MLSVKECNLHCKVQRYIGAVQNCGCQMAKLDIATSLLYQYYATVPVLIFFRIFSQVKSVTTANILHP